MHGASSFRTVHTAAVRFGDIIAAYNGLVQVRLIDFDMFLYFTALLLIQEHTLP